MSFLTSYRIENGIAIEKLLPGMRKSENCCASCGEILGAPTMCRTLERNGQIFEAIPAAIIVEGSPYIYQDANKING